MPWLHGQSQPHSCHTGFQFIRHVLSENLRNRHPRPPSQRRSDQRRTDNVPVQPHRDPIGIAEPRLLRCDRCTPESDDSHLEARSRNAQIDGHLRRSRSKAPSGSIVAAAAHACGWCSTGVSGADSGYENPLVVAGVARRLGAPAFGQSGDKERDASYHEVHDQAHAWEREPRRLT